ncbi:MAG: hypothetical protein JXB36_07245 [Gammaproteobacteria bacterium]|nr:hypothetical protein [Gammaproteobacteria bacterium]
MDSKTGQRAPKLAGRILMFAVTVVPGGGFAQPDAERSPSDRQRALVEQIQEEQARNGARSADLVAPLTALGLFYQEQGDRALAAAALEQARQIIRVNQGLSSVEEAYVLRQLVRIEEARGNVEAAWELEQEVLALAAENSDDLRVVPLLREVADNRLKVLDRYRSGEFPPQIVLGCYYGKRPPQAGPGGLDYLPHNDRCRSGSRRVVIRSLLWEARLYQARAADVLVRHAPAANDALRDLVSDTIRSSYDYGDAFLELVLRPITDYETATSMPLLTRAETLVQLADLNVLRAHRARSFREYDAVPLQYEQAYEQLRGEGVAQASIDEIFSPEIPVVLPAVYPNPLVSEKTASAGFIDVAFDITRYGESENEEILDTKNATGADRRSLLRLIRRGVFRPRVVGGRIAESSRVIVRYHLDD